MLQPPSPQLDHPDVGADWVDPSALADVCANDTDARHALITLFIEESRMGIAKLGLVIAARHAATVEVLAHEIRGRAAVFGAFAMERAADHIDRAAGESCWSQATLQHAALERSFEMTCAEIDPDREAGDRIARILIADDDPLVRSMLCQTLSDEFDIVGTACDAAEAIALAQQTRPDAAIVDLQMPDGGGMHATREICRRVPETAVVMLSIDECAPHVLAAIEVGAMAYVRKGAQRAQLVRALRASIKAHALVPASPS